jgi:hypothetical protein
VQHARDPLDLVVGVVAGLLALIVGGFTGVVTTFVHRQAVAMLGPVPVPLGLVAGLLIIAAVVAGFRLAFSSRAVGLAAAAGAIAAIGVLALPGAGGSALVLGDALGWTWAVAPAVVVVLVLLPPWRATAARSGAGRDGD